MNVGSLFSGIGGLDEGLRRAGMRHLFLCEGGGDPNGTKAEREQWKTGEWRRRVLRERFPGVPVYDDVRRVADESAGLRGEWPSTDLAGERQPEPWRERGANGVDLLCGGFPCQDLSVAGQRRGLAGDRSGLFFEFARVAESLRPRWLLVENVPGLLSSQGGRDFGLVLESLAELGYGLAWRVLDSRFFGVPQRRRRVFVVGAFAVGDSQSAGERAGQVLAVGSRCPGHPPAGVQAGEDVAGTLGGGAGERGWAQDVERMTFIADTVRSHPRPGSNSDGNVVAFNWQTGGDFRPNIGPESPALQKEQTVAVNQGASVRRLTPRECERLQGLPDDWTALGPDSRRYAALGDAVTVNVAEWIGRRLLRVAGAV